MPAEYMIADQRFAATRPDVLVYQTEPLTERYDHRRCRSSPVCRCRPAARTAIGWSNSLTFTLAITPILTRILPDVRMGSYQQLVRGEPMRGKFRHGYGQPQPFEPGKVTKVEWVMPDICHTFRTGHRIMVQVQSSWFPLLDRNPQTFCDIYHAKPEDFRKATQRVYHTATAPSAMSVSVLPVERHADKLSAELQY